MRWAGLRVKRVDELLAGAADERFLLRRALGPLNVTLLGVGAIVGAGGGHAVRAACPRSTKLATLK